MALTPDQQAWAATHDWFVRDVTDGHGNAGVVVNEVSVWGLGTVPDDVKRYTPAGNAVTEREVTFYDYQALRAWAGY